jgi:hypothetical protein
MFNGSEDGKQPTTNRAQVGRLSLVLSPKGDPNSRAMMALLTKYNISSKFITIHRIPDTT